MDFLLKALWGMFIIHSHTLPSSGCWLRISFPKKAVQLIPEDTGGSPGAVNKLCHSLPQHSQMEHSLHVCHIELLPGNSTQSWIGWEYRHMFSYHQLFIWSLKCVCEVTHDCLSLIVYKQLTLRVSGPDPTHEQKFLQADEGLVKAKWHLYEKLTRSPHK